MMRLLKKTEKKKMYYIILLTAVKRVYKYRTRVTRSGQVEKVSRFFFFLPRFSPSLRIIIYVQYLYCWSIRLGNDDGLSQPDRNDRVMRISKATCANKRPLPIYYSARD